MTWTLYAYLCWSVAVSSCRSEPLSEHHTHTACQQAREAFLLDWRRVAAVQTGHWVFRDAYCR